MKQNTVRVAKSTGSGVLMGQKGGERACAARGGLHRWPHGSRRHSELWARHATNFFGLAPFWWPFLCWANWNLNLWATVLWAGLVFGLLSSLNLFYRNFFFGEHWYDFFKKSSSYIISWIRDFIICIIKLLCVFIIYKNNKAK